MATKRTRRGRETQVKTRQMPRLRYVLRTVIEVDADDVADVVELIERNRELGECTIDILSIVSKAEQ